MITKKPVTNPSLKTWIALNDVLMAPETTEADIEKLWKAEMLGRARRVFLKRIRSRHNRLRFIREQRELFGDNQ